jgi:hypothetical protein
METGFWNANSRTNEIAFKFGTELTSTSRRVDRFARPFRKCSFRELSAGQLADAKFAAYRTSPFLSLILMPASDTVLRRQVDTRGFFAKEAHKRSF